MSKPSLTIFGPAGSGKTKNAEKLAKRFGFARIWDEGKEPANSTPPAFGALVLQIEPPEDLQHAMHIKTALSLINA